jgi:hypothetical protein
LPPPLDPLQIKHCWNADLTPGIDPNRTFAADWPHQPGNLDPRSSGYAGKRPFGAPETRALVKMARQLRPQISVHYHGPCGFPFYPGAWKDGSFPKEQELFQTVAREFAIRSAPAFRADVPETSPYPCAIGGTAFKWGYQEFYGVHLCPEGFYEQLVYDPRVIPISGVASIPELVACNLDAMIWLAQRLQAAALTVQVKNDSGQPLQARVEVLSRMDKHCAPQYADRKHGYYHRILSPGTYAVRLCCRGYQTKVIRKIKITDRGLTQLKVGLNKAGRKNE